MSSRRLRRFFTADALRAPGDTVLLTPADTEHLRRTLRMKEGDSCLVTSGDGIEAEAVISDVLGSQAKLLIQKLTPRKSAQGLSLFIYPAFIQKGKMDELVRQMQELGIQGFFPIETERTVVKMTAEAKEKVAERWEKIVQEAAKQSGSLQRLKIDAPRPLKDILARLPAESVLAFFHPGSESKHFRVWVNSLCHPEEGRSPDEGSRSFASLRMTQKTCHLFFGPEGGFSEKEIALLESQGAARVGLGETILKADTAVLGTAAALKFLFL